MYEALFFFKIPNKLINPAYCKIEPNCSEPTAKPNAIKTSPDPERYDEWKFVKYNGNVPLFNKYFEVKRW